MRTSEPELDAGAHVAPPGRRRRRRRWVTAVVLLVVLGGVGAAGFVGWTRLQESLFMPSCTVTASGSTYTFAPDQTGNAALIAAISDKRGLPARAATIAIATALQESKLRNLAYGDRDSVGLFQQRPSAGWGTREQILDPVYATNKFYDALVKIPGYETMEITKVAQKVQRSAYPEAYADHEQEGRVLASTLRGHSPAGLGCQLRPATAATDAATVAADLAAQLGVSARAEGGSLVVAAPTTELAWAAGHWGVARAEGYGIDQVTVGDQAWNRSTKPSAAGWSAGEPVPSATTVRLTLHAS